MLWGGGQWALDPGPLEIAQALVSCGKQLSVDKPWPSDDDLERRLGKRPSTQAHSRQSLTPKKGPQATPPRLEWTAS